MLNYLNYQNKKSPWIHYWAILQSLAYDTSQVFICSYWARCCPLLIQQQFILYPVHKTFYSCYPELTVSVLTLWGKSNGAHDQNYKIEKTCLQEYTVLVADTMFTMFTILPV